MTIATVHWKQDFLSCFKQGQRLSLNGPICLLVGECGSGKSTLLRLLSQGSNELADVEYGAALPAFLHDFERDSPRTKPMSSWKDADEAAACLSAAQMSHGQANLKLIDEIEEKKDCLLLLDEPESGLSPKSLVRLYHKMTVTAIRGKVRIVCATHSPVLAYLNGSVFDLSVMRQSSVDDWMGRQGFSRASRICL